MMYVLKGLCIIGIVLCAVLMWKKTKEMAASDEKDPVTGMTGKELIAFDKKKAVYTTIVGFIANFLDTFGIGSYAPTSAAFKLGKAVDDSPVPGTLNVGDTIPVCFEAFLFFGFVDMDILTLVLMLVAAVIGSLVMAGVVSKFDRKKVRYSLFFGLFLLATVVLMRNLGVGLYAPCMAMVLVLGMDAGCAFPAMMGSCAFLMAFGNGPKFIKEGKFDPICSWTQAIGGAIGVYVAYAFVKSMPLDLLTKIIVVVVYLTAFLYLKDAIKKGSEA